MSVEMVTVQQLADVLGRWAPWDDAEQWDNVGVLAGAAAPVSGVLCTLDITPAVVHEAVRRGCSAVVSHHPVIFSPLKALVPGTAPYLLARHGIAAVCAHTNLDKAPGGVGDALATALGLSGIEPCGSYCRRGTLPHEMTPRGFAAHVQAALGVPVRLVDAGAPPQATRLSAKARASTSASAFFICFSPLLQFFRRHIISSEMIQLAKL